MARLELANFLPYRLHRLGATVSYNFRMIYGPAYDLTVPEWRVLATLGEFDGIGAKAIGKHSAMHKTKVSRAVRALDERRWLKRRRSEQDRREELLSLTPLGRRTYVAMAPVALAFEAKLMADLGSEAKALLRALDKIERSLSLK